MAPFFPPRRETVILPPSQTGQRVSPWMQIAMSRLKGVNFNELDETVEVGAGYLLGDVYAALEALQA